MKRLIYDSQFFNEPTQETFNKLNDELMYCVRAGFMSINEYNIIIKYRKKILDEVLDGSTQKR